MKAIAFVNECRCNDGRLVKIEYENRKAEAIVKEDEL